MSLVLSERRNAIEVIHLNRPDKLKALTRDMSLALTDQFENLAGDKTLRAIIFTGAGNKAFCAGTDIAELRDHLRFWKSARQCLREHSYVYWERGRLARNERAARKRFLINLP